MKYYTHSGLFHCDEVTGYAICSLAGICDSFERLTDINNLPDDGLIADIGRVYDPTEKRFDHHQGFLTRPNGYPYASAGLLWNEFAHLAIGKLIVPNKFVKEVALRVEERLIQGIDAHDADSDYYASAECSAGPVRITTLPMVVSTFNCQDVHDDDQPIRFILAAQFIKDILVSEIKSAAKFFEDAERFGAISDKVGATIILSEHCDWKEIVAERYPDAKFVIAPSAHPGNPFSLLAVPVDPERREIKITIERPDWFTGFIHQGKWIAGGKSVEELMQLSLFNLTR